MGTWQATSRDMKGTSARLLAAHAAARGQKALRSMWALSQLLTSAKLPKLWRLPCPES